MTYYNHRLMLVRLTSFHGGFVMLVRMSRGEKLFRLEEFFGREGGNLGIRLTLATSAIFGLVFLCGWWAAIIIAVVAVVLILRWGRICFLP